MKSLFRKLLKVWKLLVLFLLILLTYSYAMFQGGFVSWFLFYSFLPFALFALMVAIYPLKSYTAERKFLKNEYNAGESLKVTVLIRRKSTFPLLFIVVEDCLNGKLQNSQKGLSKGKTILFPGLKKEMVWEYEIDTLPRGEHLLQAIRIKTGDLLGLYEKEKFISVEDKIIVYPSFEDIIYRPYENQYEQGMTSSRERVQRDTSMAIGIREYQPGDRFSWINWKASAKRNEIMTKEFEQRQSHDVFLLLDCSPNNRFEAMVSFTASLTRAILRKGAQVGFLACADERMAIPISGGENQQLLIFYQLAKINDESSVSFDRVIKTESTAWMQSSILMLITSQLSSQLIDTAGILTSNRRAVTIFLVKNEKESLTKGELALKAAANARGLRIVLVQDGHFAAAFRSEVAVR